jgi:hypothetical protein
MPLTVIEAAMFSGGGTHAVTAFALAPTTIALSVAPWTGEAAQARGQDTDETAQRSGYFPAARLLAREVMDDDVPEDQEPPLPWDIIGFDARDLSHGRWRFVLQCREIAYVWESAWPRLEPPN